MTVSECDAHVFKNISLIFYQNSGDIGSFSGNPKSDKLTCRLLKSLESFWDIRPGSARHRIGGWGKEREGEDERRGEQRDF